MNAKLPRCAVPCRALVLQDELIDSLRSLGRQQAASRMLRQKQRGDSSQPGSQVPSTSQPDSGDDAAMGLGTCDGDGDEGSDG